MKYVAQPHPLNAEVFVVRQHGHCKYPWCKNPEFLDGDRDKAVHALVVNLAGVTVTGNMHVRHTILAYRFDGSVTEFYEDDTANSAEMIRTAEHARPASGKLLEDIVNTVPTWTEFASNVERLVKELEEGQVLVIAPGARTARTVRVNIWRRML